MGAYDCDCINNLEYDRRERKQKEQSRSTARSTDLISRQAALEKVRAMQTYKLFMGDDMILVDKAEVQTELMMLPSAQPERKRGEWVYNSPVTMKCNRCGLVIKDWDWHRFKICPNCGADMRGEQDG